MAKKRKTRQEKMIADLRRQLATQTPETTSPRVHPNNTYSLSFNKDALQKTPVAGSSTKTINYTYILSDLRKTALLSILAVAVQVVLYLVLVRG